MAGWLYIAVFMAAAAAGQRARPVIRPRPAAATLQPQAGPSFSVSVTPATVTFQATDPDKPAVAGDSAAQVSWRLNGQTGAAWNLTVQALSDPLTNCPGIPASAITVICSEASAGGQGTATCAGAFPLSTRPLQVAGGSEGNGNTAYHVQISYTIGDTWKRIAQLSPTCSLSLTYIVNMP